MPCSACGWSTPDLGAALAYLAVSPILARQGNRMLTAAGLTCLGAGTLLTGIAPHPAVALGGLSIAGHRFLLGADGRDHPDLERVPESLRGRTMALWSIAFVGSRPLGAAASGALTDTTSVSAAFIGVAAVVALLGVASHLGATEQSLTFDPSLP